MNITILTKPRLGKPEALFLEGLDLGFGRQKFLYTSGFRPRTGLDSWVKTCTCTHMNVFLPTYPKADCRRRVVSGQLLGGSRRAPGQLFEHVFDGPIRPSKIGNLHKIYPRFLPKTVLETGSGIKHFSWFWGARNRARKVLIPSSGKSLFRGPRIATFRGSREAWNSDFRQFCQTG